MLLYRVGDGLQTLLEEVNGFATLVSIALSTIANLTVGKNGFGVVGTVAKAVRGGLSMAFVIDILGGTKTSVSLSISALFITLPLS